MYQSELLLTIRLSKSTCSYGLARKTISPNQRVQYLSTEVQIPDPSVHDDSPAGSALHPVYVALSVRYYAPDLFLREESLSFCALRRSHGRLLHSADILATAFV